MGNVNLGVCGVTATDSDGNTRTETYTERKRVNTHSASGQYEFAAWADKSGFITGLQNFLLTKIKYSKVRARKLARGRVVPTLVSVTSRTAHGLRG